MMNDTKGYEEPASTNAEERREVMSSGNDSEKESPLEEARREIQHLQRGEEQERRTEVRGTRLSESEADRLDEIAEKAGLSISTLIRVMCLSEERPDKKLLAAALREIRALVSSLPTGNSGENAECALSAEELSDLRRRIDDICSGLVTPPRHESI